MKIVVAIGSNEFGQQIKELLGIERYEFVSVDSFIHSKTQFFILDQNHSKIIQQLKAQHLRPLVFFLANDNSPQDLLSAFDLGIDDYICCPFNSDIFIRKVNVLLARLPRQFSFLTL